MHSTALSLLIFLAVPSEPVNSVGIRMVRIEPGSFAMGQTHGGDPDERPVHRVAIAQRFWVGATEVTNAQYELFDPAHKALRGNAGFSRRDDEAVVFVSWRDATRFCRWLSEREGKPYRLPTEAEWEYACRAGATTRFHTGRDLPAVYHRHQAGYENVKTSHRKRVSLRVGVSPANAWGLHEMHGNVEEWCLDWYGPYAPRAQTDPIGAATGLFRVTRGGSHNTDVYYLRSANRLAAPPDDRHWHIGFRVVMAPLPKSAPAPPAAPGLCMRDVRQTKADWTPQTDMTEPFFAGPVRFVREPPAHSGDPFFPHNHAPSVTYCPNGDLLVAWFSCRLEWGREMVILASRLRAGREEWDAASLFFKAPDRNMTIATLWADPAGVLRHFNGLGEAGWHALATTLRTSTDNGASWTAPRLINPEHGAQAGPIETVFRTREGFIVLPLDSKQSSTALCISRDGGRTWPNPGLGRRMPALSEGGTGPRIAGIHAAVAQLADGSLLAFGRRQEIAGWMTQSVSHDMGANWTYSASAFPPIAAGQRSVLNRLREGPLLFVSFTDADPRRPEGMRVADASGAKRRVYGMFAALSFDEGRTWPVRKLITPGGPTRTLDGGGWTGEFRLSATHAEPRGYLTLTQTPDGIVHLLSSALHYRFNYAWLNAPAAPLTPPRVKRRLPRVFVADRLPSRARPAWRFTGSGVDEPDAVLFPVAATLELKPGERQRSRWAQTSADGFGAVDAEKGFTVELRVQVLTSTDPRRGVDLEAYVGDGVRRGAHHMISVTRTGVYCIAGGRHCLAEGLDNHSQMHTYRLAVWPDGDAWIYRDAELLARRPAGLGMDKMLAPSGPYLQWGDGAIGAETRARVAYVAYDLSGPFRPEGSEE